MSDEAKRRHERAAESGDRAAAVRALRERVREGSLLPGRLELAAYAGDEVAFEALSPVQKERLVESAWFWFRPTAESLWEVLERTSEEVRLRVVLDALRRGFEAIGMLPIVSGRLREIRAALERVPTREEMRLIQHVAEEARDATLLITTYAEHASIADTAAALALALEGNGRLGSAFMAAMRPGGGRALEATIESLRSIAPEIDEELARYVGSPGARTGKRPPRASLHWWLMGVERFGTTAVLRALLAHRRGEIRDPHLLRRLETWIAEPSPVELVLVSPASGARYRLREHPLGLPDDRSAEQALYFSGDSGNDVRDEAGDRELVAFALSEEPLFRFHGLDVFEELPAHPRGWTYRATDPATRDELLLLALNVPVPAAPLETLARSLMKLDHPNLARILRLGVGGEGDVRPAFLVYARALGVKLEEWRAVERSLEEKLAVIRGVLDGLEHAHARGVVHGCLIASSVLVTGGEGRVVDLGHFALERLEDWNADDPPAFSMDPSHAPEFGEDETGTHGDPRTDVYGAAALAVLILTGRPVFEGSGMDLGLAIQREHPRPLPYRDAVLRRALAKSPGDRFPSIAAFRAALFEGSP